MSDITSCVYIGRLSVIEPCEFNRLAGEFSTWSANINSSYNKVFVGINSVYEAVRILSTISIIARRPEVTSDLLESDFNSIYDYFLKDLTYIAESHTKFMQKSPIKFYIYSKQPSCGEYKFSQTPVSESVFSDKFEDSMFECTFSIILNDIGKFVRYQDVEKTSNSNIYNQPHNVFNDYSRLVQTPKYSTEFQNIFSRDTQPAPAPYQYPYLSPYQYPYEFCQTTPVTSQFSFQHPAPTQFNPATNPAPTQFNPATNPAPTQFGQTQFGQTNPAPTQFGQTQFGQTNQAPTQIGQTQF